MDVQDGWKEQVGAIYDVLHLKCCIAKRVIRKIMIIALIIQTGRANINVVLTQLHCIQFAFLSVLQLPTSATA